MSADSLWRGRAPRIEFCQQRNLMMVFGQTEYSSVTLLNFEVASWCGSATKSLLIAQLRRGGYIYFYEWRDSEQRSAYFTVPYLVQVYGPKEN